jgi:imidazoleglycerol-phosphate dehydratase
MASSSKGGTRKNGRRGALKRETKETSIRVEVDLDNPSTLEVRTGIGFFDHMLSALSVHGRMGLVIEAEGDLHVDQHHLVEDVGIALGTAFREALGSDPRIRRFGHAYAPLDDALARAVVDASGRSFLRYNAPISRLVVGEFETDLVREFFQGFAANARVNLHIDLLHGENAHHQVEAIFKAVALALRDAAAIDPSLGAAPSTKGTIS